MKKRELRWCYFEWWYSRWNRTGKPIKSIYIYSVVFVQFVEIIYWRLKNLHFKFCTRACKLATRPGCVFVPPDSDEGTTSRLSNVALTPARIFAPTKAVLHTDRGAPCIATHAPNVCVYMQSSGFQNSNRFGFWNRKPRTATRSETAFWRCCVRVCVCVCVYIYIYRERERESWNSCVTFGSRAYLPLLISRICTTSSKSVS